MRLAWVTPLVQGSAIARESLAVCDALRARGHEVRLIGSEWERPAPRALRATSLPHASWRDTDLSRLADEVDLAVVTFGDNFPFHGGGLEVLAHAPCLGVFHDFYLHNLFRGWLQAHGFGAARRARELVETYGTAVGDIAAAEHLDSLDLADLAARAPMTEWAARRCAGALAHAPFYLSRLAACPGPLALADLPVASRGVAPLTQRRRPQLTVLTVGVMNRNKCVDRVLGAIAGSPQLRERMRYRLAGPISPAERARLEALASQADYGGLTILDAVDEPTLTAELTAADIVCCLRQPVLEGASGSAIEGLLSGRPVIVADAGFYGGLPDDLVTKVAPDVPVEGLRHALERLAANEPARRRQGAAAARWAAETFTTSRYLAVLEPLLGDVQAALPLAAAAHAFGRDLKALGVAAHDPAVDRLGALLDGLFGAA